MIDLGQNGGAKKRAQQHVVVYVVIRGTRSIMQPSGDARKRLSIRRAQKKGREEEKTTHSAYLLWSLCCSCFLRSHLLEDFVEQSGECGGDRLGLCIRFILTSTEVDVHGLGRNGVGGQGWGGFSLACRWGARWCCLVPGRERVEGSALIIGSPWC